MQANFYHCAVYGSPIPNNNGGPDPEGCTMGQYSDAVMNVFKELALDEMDHVQGIQTYLGACFTTCVAIATCAIAFAWAARHAGCAC